MYIPTHYSVSDLRLLHGLIDAYPLGAWVVASESGLSANHLPFLIDADRGENGTVLCHVARANPVWRTPSPSMVIFQGPAAYVSPSWYPSKELHHRVVPTWNYAAVHVHGVARAIHDPAWLLDCLERLTAKHEATSRTPWRISDAPAEYIERQLGAIVGIEIQIDRIEGKWKMSQNQSDSDRQGIADGLRAGLRGDDVACLVEAGRRKP